MKTDLAPTRAPDLTPDADVSLLPRADLPVIWDGFKAKAEGLRTVAETLTVTDISQKEEMALARTTRLTLREIRIAVEAKRVELGESHLKEIKKVNGAATAIKEFIQPLEARLLIQESFAEQHEILRIAELSRERYVLLSAVRANTFIGDLGTMTQEIFDAHFGRLRDEKAEIEAANRLRVEAESRLAAQKLEMELREVAIRAERKRLNDEAEKQLAEVRAEAQKRAIELQLELKAESDRLKAEAQVEAQRVAVIREAQLAEARAESDRQQADAEQRAKELHEERCREYELKAQEIQRQRAAEDAAKAVRDADLAEQKRIRDEQYAKLEAELKAERAVKQAEADAARKLAVAPDVEKLRDYYERLRGVKCPVPLATQEARDCFEKVVVKFNDMASIINEFCQK